MIRVLTTLAVITALAAAGAHFGYRELEKRLLASSCLPAPPAGPAGLAAEDGAGSAPEPEAVPAAQNFQIIVSRDIFRSSVPDRQEKKTEPKPSPVETAPPTTLNLTLSGTVLGSGRGQTSRAIIINNAGRERKQQLLQIGDGVPDTAAVIKEIDWESVTLEVNGRQEILTMPKPKSAPGFGPQAMIMPPTPAMPPPGEARGGRPPVRPNRRINLPPEEPPPIVEEPPPPEEEIPLPEEAEAPLPELPSPDAE
ncbi:MAG: type II secretion system protein N [Candidatus Electronema sp. V4]|uniref:type II secretion system protein N n=1 Tax=Candidatus Electronema sp. V4 TaxID=3454756 RepID=UPI0040559623